MQISLALFHSFCAVFVSFSFRFNFEFEWHWLNQNNNSRSKSEKKLWCKCPMWNGIYKKRYSDVRECVWRRKQKRKSECDKDFGVRSMEMSRNVTKSQITWKHISTRIDSVSLSYHAPKINGVCNIGIFLLSFSLPCEFMLIYNISEIGISWINYRKLGKKTARKSKAKQNKRKPKQIAIKCKRFLWIKFGNQKVFVNAYFDKRLKKLKFPPKATISCHSGYFIEIFNE